MLIRRRPTGSRRRGGGSRIYITHGHGDHWLGLARLIQRFPGAIGQATAEVLA
jgi:glyoxylase-like metal-dependent hydrolase (beta-lactamase superfamily II)